MAYKNNIKNENNIKVVQGVPAGGQKYFGAGSVTGAIKIDLPTSKTSTEFNFEVTIDTYQGVFYKLLISGLNWSAGFGSSSNNRVRFIGTSTIPNVYFCTGATNDYILIGEITDSRSDLSVTIKNVQTQRIVQDWSTGWNISLATTLETLDTTKKVTIIPSLNSTSLVGYTWATQKGFKYNYTVSASSDTSQYAVFRIADFFASDPTSPIYIEGFTTVWSGTNIVSAVNGNIGMKRLSLLALQNKTVAYRYEGEDYKENLAYLYYENNDLLIVFNKPNLYGSNAHRLNIYTDISYTITTASNVTSTTLSTYTLLETLKNNFVDWTTTGEVNKMPVLDSTGNLVTKDIGYNLSALKHSSLSIGSNTHGYAFCVLLTPAYVGKALNENRVQGTFKFNRGDSGDGANSAQYLCEIDIKTAGTKNIITKFDTNYSILKLCTIVYNSVTYYALVTTTTSNLLRCTFSGSFYTTSTAITSPTLISNYTADSNVGTVTYVYPDSYIAEGLYKRNSSAGSSIFVNGGWCEKYSTITSSATLDSTYNIILCNSTSAITLTLPTASSHANRIYKIKNISTGVVTIAGYGGTQLIDGSTTTTLSSQYTYITLMCNGTAWYKI